MAALGRGARGLPRYFMDVGWYRHPTFAGLSMPTLFLFEACVGYCTEHATDGRLPSHHEDLAAALGLRASEVKKALQPLVEREILEPVGGHFVIDGWADHNPTAEEVKAHSEERRRAGQFGAHKRYHVKKNVVDPTCEWCTDSSSDSSSHSSSDPTAMANGSHRMGLDSKSSSKSQLATDDDDKIRSHIQAHYDHKLWDENPIRSLERFTKWAVPKMRQVIAEARDEGEDPWESLELVWPTHVDHGDGSEGDYEAPDDPGPVVQFRQRRVGA